jgi:aminoglycoside phosphotransferase (APT) family kinase protein
MTAANMLLANASPLRTSRRDLDALRPIIRQWLAANVTNTNNIDDISVTAPTSAGVANETLMVSTVMAGRPGPGYVFRLQGEEHLYPGADIAHHARICDRISQCSKVPVPRIHGVEDNPDILGSRFMVMEWVRGRVPPDVPNFHRAGWLKALPPARREAIWRDCIAQMARLHAMDPANFQFLHESGEAKDDGPYQGRSGLSSALKYWDVFARWCSGDELPIIAAARYWLWAKLPKDEPGGFAWGDARLPNVIVRGDRCVAILDWDMASLAGPEADLAWWALADHKHTLTLGVPRLSGIGSPAETIRLWESLSGRSVRNMDWYLVYTAYSHALISYRLFRLNNGADVSIADFMAAPGISVQWLASLIGYSLPMRLTMPFSGLEL